MLPKPHEFLFKLGTRHVGQGTRGQFIAWRHLVPAYLSPRFHDGPRGCRAVRRARFGVGGDAL